MKLISQGIDQGTLTSCLNCFKPFSISSWPVNLDIRRWAELQKAASQMSSFPHKWLTSSHSLALGVREFRWVSISPGPPPSLVLHLDAWVQGCSSCCLLVLTLQRFDKVPWLSVLPWGECVPVYVFSSRQWVISSYNSHVTTWFMLIPIKHLKCDFCI